MSARNTLAAKRARREARTARRESTYLAHAIGAGYAMLQIGGTGERHWTRRGQHKGVAAKGAAEAEAYVKSMYGDFTCDNCDTRVVPDTKTANHCPECLWSKHVWFGLNPCGALMEPVDTFPGPGQADWNVVWHRCTGCGYEALAPVTIRLDELHTGMWSAAMWEREPLEAA